MVDKKNSYAEQVSKLINWGHWFSFCNIILAMLIGTMYISQSPWPSSLFGQFYLLVSWLGHFSFLVFALYLLVLFPLTFVISSQKTLRLISAAFATAGLTLLLLDTQAYKTIHLHLSPVVWELLFSEEKNAFNADWQYIFVAVPVIFLLQIAISEWVWKKQRKLSHKGIGKPAAIFFFLCFMGSHFIYIWADAFLYKPITMQRANFPLSYPMTAKSFMEKHGLLDREEYRQQLEKNGNVTNILNYPLERLEFDGRGKQYNILVIMVNNLRNDMLKDDIMPNTYQFAQNNQNFINHYSASNDIYGVFGLLYGLPSSYAFNIKSQNTQPLILSTMKDRKYNMAAFSSDRFEDAEFYEQIFAPFDMSKSNKDTIKLSDKRTIKDWKQWLEKSNNKPWFSYIELSKSDEFEQADQILPQFIPSTTTPEDKLKARYKSAVYKVDKRIAEVIQELESQNTLDNTVVVITSNHGTEFNETKNNTWGSNSNFSRYQLQVPMIIHWPNKAPELYQHKTSHLDLSTTLMMDVFQVTSNPYDLGSGKNLFDINTRPWILAGDSENIALITDDTTTVVDQYGNYKVYNEDYQRDKEIKPKLSIVLQGLSELKRFYGQSD